MTALLDLQRGFRDAVLRDAPPPVEILGGRVSAAARIDVYRNNVFGNLTASLGLTFPATRRMVGEDFFAAAAARFIPDHPPSSPDLYEYGAAFPDFLRDFPPAAALAWAPDLARLEWAVCRAIHADPLPPLDPALLAGCADAAFIAHPTLALLALSTPARAIWAAALIADDTDRAEALGAIDPAAPGGAVAVLAPDGVLAVHEIDAATAGLAGALAAGVALSEALAPIAEADAAALFTRLLADGFLAAIRPEPMSQGFHP